MLTLAKIFGAALLLTGAGAASAQVMPPVNPGNTPEGPQGRPMSMGENDSSTNPSAQQQIDRAAELARTGRSDGGGHARTRPAKADELIIGSDVRDKKGVLVGSIQMVESDGAVVQTLLGKVKVPLDAFGMDQKGLIIGIAKSEFDKLVAAANAAPAG